MTPRVTFDGDIVLKLVVESSTLGQDVNIAGQNLPSFGSRKVETTLRLRDGESTLLAGLLREDERRTLTGFPGLMRLPVFKQLFTSNDLSKGQTDIVMLLTPRDRPRPRADAGGRQSGLHRLAAASRAERAAAADRAAGGRTPATAPRAAPAPAPPGWNTGQPTPMPARARCHRPASCPTARPAADHRRQTPPQGAADAAAEPPPSGRRRRGTARGLVGGGVQRRAARRDAAGPGVAHGRRALHGAGLGEQRAARRPRSR